MRNRKKRRVKYMRKYTGSTNHSDRATRGKDKGSVMVNLKENHRDEEEIKRLNEECIAQGRPPRYDLELAKENIELIVPSELTIEGCYKDVFQESIDRYNLTQWDTRRLQSVEKLLSKIENSNKNIEPMQSMVVQVGNKDHKPKEEELTEIYKEYLEKFQEKFPNMKVVSATIHIDEGRMEGTSHLQFYYIPIKKKSLCSEEKQKKWRGIDEQMSMSGALEQMGYSNDAKIEVEVDGEKKLKHDYKNGALAQFQKDFNKLLDDICLEHNIEVQHPLAGKKATRKDTQSYYEDKARMDSEISQLKEDVTQLKKEKEIVQNDLKVTQDKVDSLNVEKNALEGQIRTLKDRLEVFVEKFENLVKKVKNREWGDIFKQRKADAAIRSGTKEKETVEDFLNDNDLTSEIPIDSIGRFMGATNKLEELDEEWER